MTPLPAFLELVAINGTVLLIAGFALSRLLRRASASSRHLVWAVCLLGLVLMPVGGFLLPSLRLPVLPASWTGTATGAIGFELSSTSALRPETATGDGSGAVGATLDPATRPGTDLRHSGATVFHHGFALGLWVVYLAGVVLLLARTAHGLLRVHRLTRAAVPFDTQAVAGDRTHALMPLRARVLMSREISTPVTWGFIRPVVLMPSAAEAWEVNLVRNALTHEFAHIERLDWASALVGRLACAIAWFHPLVWSAAARMFLEAERACDDRVLLSGSESRLYAGQLLRLARTLNHSDRALSTAVPLARSRQLPTRIDSMLDPSLRRTPMTRTRILLISLAGVLPMLLLGTVHAVPAADRSAGDPLATVLAEPLIEAVDSGDRTAVEALLAAGADPNSFLAGDGTPLIAAASSGNLELVDLLLDMGADPDLPAAGDGSPLIAAAANGHLDVARRLIGAGASIDLIVPEDETALMQAAAAGQLNMVRYLIDEGADANLVATTGAGEERSALTQARRGGHQGIVDLLAQRGAGL